MGKYTWKQIIFIGLLGASLLLSFLFHQTQHGRLHQLLKERVALESRLQKLKTDSAFLIEHSQDKDVLKAKGWETPVSRLVAAQFIEKEGEILDEITFTFAHELREDFYTPYSYRVTKINVQVKAVQEHEILTFLKGLLEHFPGLLILQKVHISRVRDIQEALSSKQSLLLGELDLDWIAPEEVQGDL